jgi:hypothetical protein
MSEYSLNAPMTDEEIPLEVRNTLPEETFRLKLEADCRAAGFDPPPSQTYKDTTPRIWEIKLFRAIHKNDIEFVKGVLAKHIYGEENLIRPLIECFDNTTVPAEIWKFLDFTPLDFMYVYISKFWMQIPHDEQNFLQFAIKIDRFEIIKLLLKVDKIDVQHACIKELPIILALQKNMLETVELLLNKDQNLANAQDIMYKMPCLTLAVEKNFVEIVQLLLRQPNINVNLQNSFEETALMFAIFKNFPHLVRMLLEMPYIDIDVRDCQGQKALYHAVHRHGEESEIAQMILEHRRNKRQRTN